MIKSWYNQPTLRTYDDAAKLFATARFPDNGKPFKSWCRLFKNGDAYEIKHPLRSSPLAMFKPDNTFVITAEPRTLRVYSTTLTRSVHRALPISIERLGTGRYGAMHYAEIDSRYHMGEGFSGFMKRNSYQIFTGLTFDLTTGKCINSTPSTNDKVDVDKRLEWQRSLRRFKMGVAVRVRLGVLDSLCTEVSAERSLSNGWVMPDWFSEEWSSLLHQCIRDEQYPTKLLKGFVETSDVSYWRREAPTPSKALEAMHSVTTDLSAELRRRFGVFVK